MSENTQTQEQQFEGPFDAIAYLLMIARLGMENANAEGELPRYVRIARAQEIIDSNQIPDWLEAPAKWARFGVEGLNFFISRLITLTLQARDVLKGTDALIALSEIALEMINVATSDEFWTAIGNAVDPEDEGSVAIPSDTVITSFNNENFDLPKIKKWLKHIPNPEDLNRIGYELYRMSCLTYKDDHTIDIKSTGKLRLLQYTFDQKWEVFHLDEYIQTTKLGQEETETFNNTSIVYNPDEGGPSIPLFLPIPLSGKSGQEDDVDAILTKLKYGTSNANNIRLFQKEHNLATQGQLNEETINRFFNLDSEHKNLAWAKEKEGNYVDAQRYPMGYLPLVNGNADDYTSEGLTPVRENGSKYRYYEIRTENIFPTDGQGWIRKIPVQEGNINYINGFVAIESRFIDISREQNGPIYEGGLLSEGEAASGRFFFVARDTEPWIPGRKGTPTSTLIYDDAQTAPAVGHISRMYQDIEMDVSDLLSKPLSSEQINTYQIAFEASCLRRSLYTDRSGVKKILGQPDQGRILLEVYKDDEALPIWSDPQIVAKNGWQPGAQVTSAFLKDTLINQRNNWFGQTSKQYIIDAETLITNANKKTGPFSALDFTDTSTDFVNQKLRFRVILEGKHRSGWDTDAYFDDVRLKWMFVPKPV